MSLWRVWRVFIVDKKANTIKKIESRNFHDLNFRERENLQEWIADNPECLGEELLIIQKEFDGFKDTRERLDLLALDKSGALVVIENKLDDTGRDAIWQALKYVSYCSTLTKQQIKEIYQVYLNKLGKDEDAEENIVKFLGDKPFEEISLNEDDQRMILVAGNFRKEVTSTVMWMLNHGIKVKCFKATPYEYNKQIFLNIEQIIPIKEAEEYMIVLSNKTREEKAAKEVNRGLHELRKVFWTELLEKFNKLSSRYKHVSPSSEFWLATGSGVGGAIFAFVVTKNYASVELFLNNASKEENKRIFGNLYSNKDEIEKAYGSQLSWERLDGKKSSRIAAKIYDVNITNRDDWNKIKEFLCEAMIKFEKVIKEPLKRAVAKQ